jgi:hypothetical protein
MYTFIFCKNFVLRHIRAYPNTVFSKMEAMTKGRRVDKYLGQGERKWFF